MFSVSCDKALKIYFCLLIDSLWNTYSLLYKMVSGFQVYRVLYRWFWEIKSCGAELQEAESSDEHTRVFFPSLTSPLVVYNSACAFVCKFVFVPNVALFMFPF